MWKPLKAFWDRRTEQRITQLQRAIARGEIVPWYQPLIYGAQKTVGGCEVLARWHHPVRGVRGAPEFIPLAEQSGLIVPLTRSLMRQAERDLLDGRILLPERFRVSLNLSAAHAASETFLRDCIRLQRRMDFCRGEVCAEVTERVDFSGITGGYSLVSALQDAGVKVFLDDFGTGQAGLASLEALPAEGIKLDRSHVGELPGKGPVTMAELLLVLARHRSLQVVAEGVHTRAQHEWLLSRGVLWQQGELFSMPLPAEAFRAYLSASLREEEERRLNLHAPQE